MIKSLFLIIGFHRSGTSLVSSICKNLGVSCDEKYFHHPNNYNKSGYFEDSRVLSLHDSFLNDLKKNWWNTDIFDTLKNKNKHRKFINLIIKFLQSLDSNDTFFIKDPKLILFYDLWEEASSRLNIKIFPIFIIRNPNDCYNSLKFRDGLNEYHAKSLWLSYHAHLKLIKKIINYGLFFTYESLTHDTIPTIDTLANYLKNSCNLSINKKQIISSYKLIKTKKKSKSKNSLTSDKTYYRIYDYIRLGKFSKINLNVLYKFKLDDYIEYYIQNNIILNRKHNLLNLEITKLNSEIEKINKQNVFYIAKIETIETNLKNIKWLFLRLIKVISKQI